MSSSYTTRVSTSCARTHSTYVQYVYEGNSLHLIFLHVKAIAMEHLQANPHDSMPHTKAIL